MADLYLTPAEKYTAALGGFYYGDLPEPGTVYTQLIKDILNGTTPEKEPKNILARFIYSLYISDLGDPYPRYELAKLLYWKLHNITPTKSGSILTVTIDGKEDYMTINTDLSRLWYKVLFGSKTDVITEFPYSFNTMQNKLSDWELFGNVEVSGTPTPTTPIMPQGTGERTGNLFDKTNETIGAYMLSDGTIALAQSYSLTDYIPINEGSSYTISAVTNQLSAAYHCFYTEDKVFISSINCGMIPRTFTTPANAKYIRCSYRIVSNLDIMLNTGSTPLPFEPHGYKIPISSASTTTPVYLGEVETTRKVQKLVLTGEEAWMLLNGNYYVSIIDRKGAIGTILCTHFINSSSQGISYNNKSTSGLKIASVAVPFVSDLSGLKEWLAAQYAAGTPVTVWYVLANPTTGIVNEPLMRIGEYADSMSRTQTGIDIPTVIGQNTLDVLTTVKPSSMSIEYTSADENRSRSKRISILKSPLKKGLIK